MKKILVAAAALALSATAVMAQVPTFADVDTDADGTITWEELSMGWPGLTEEQFAAADADASGGIDPTEWEILVASLELDAGAGLSGEPVPLN